MYMKMRKLFCLLSLFVSVTALAEDKTVTSPDGRLQVTVSSNDGRVKYRVDYDGAPVVLPSSLGLKTNVGDFTEGLTLKEAKEEKVEK